MLSSLGCAVMQVKGVEGGTVTVVTAQAKW